MSIASSASIPKTRLRSYWERLREVVPQGRGLPEEEWSRRHRGMLVILFINVVAVPIFGMAQGYSVLHSLGESSIVAVFAALALPHRFGRNLRSGAVAAGLLSAAALLVHFSGGYIEFHFYFFVVIALLALYQHWLPFLLAIAYVGVHHGIGGAIDPGSVYNHPDGIANPWKWAAIHAAFVLAAAAANVFAWRYFEAEQDRRRNLLRVTEAAIAQLPLPKLLDEVLLRVNEVLKADTTTISLWDEAGRLVIRSARGALSDHTGAVISAGDPVARQIATTRMPLVLQEVADQALANPVHRERQVHSLAAVPLLVAGNAIGMLDVGTAERRRFSRSDITLLELAADRIAPAIDRARLHDRDRGIALSLQRSLLPKNLPKVPGVSIAFRYQPAGESVEAGGDWYDAFTLPRGHIGIAMGDVVGRGTEAASLMGQLRTGLRAYAKEGHAPAASIARLGTLARELDKENMATLFYAEVDPDSMSLRYVNAGHPPPLLVTPGEEPRYLEGGRTTPIGVLPRKTPPEAKVSIAPGSTLVLYTDGLIESRITGLDEGMRQLVSVASNGARDADSLCDAIITEVPPESSGDDDVAVMAIRFEPTLGGMLELEYPAIPESAAQMRWVLERWLHENNVERNAVQDVVVACNEAAANAIEHAYGPSSANFRVSAARMDGHVNVAVADTGRWRAPRGHNRGRGLMLMRALMDTVDIERGERGTTVKMSKRGSGNGATPA